MIDFIKKIWNQIFPYRKPSIPIHSTNPQERLAGAFVRNYARDLRDGQKCFPINIDLMAQFNGKNVLELNDRVGDCVGFGDRTTMYVNSNLDDFQKRVAKAILFARQVGGGWPIEVKHDPYNPKHNNNQKEIDALNLSCALLIPDGALSHMMMVQKLSDPRDLANAAGVTVRCMMWRLRHLSFG